ncbi:hypothetical protein [Desulfurobacterium atlanticum]|uniref:Cytochrome c n=1 Tax=Desulfurobacterium atlanticum TaxID=240169 RepID=A0A238YDA6_9BACT|nr:hypothetical protein [Desulfurobacterium atlanticum]SNR69195.1 Cytochrome c [Desulfurobacterium atlanticum]
MRKKLLQVSAWLSVFMLTSNLSHAAVTKKTILMDPEKRFADHTEAFKALGITKYEGAKSCLPCHKKQVEDVFHSYHFQMSSKLNDVTNLPDAKGGGKHNYNDYCMSIFFNGHTINWIGKVTLKKTPPGHENKITGKLLMSGCSMCHGVSMGKPGNPNMSFEEAATDIDCLVCHISGYGGGKGVKSGLKVPVNENGRWRYESKIDLMKVASKIQKRPSKDVCLLCHAFSGGGDGVKRPNLFSGLMSKKITREIDVHMGSGMDCIDCHSFQNHKVGTVGVDTFSREAKAVSCSDCHKQPHKGIKGWFIENFHTEHIACQTCHIPLIHKSELHRDWSKIEFEGVKWGEEREIKENIIPRYAWWNGKRKLYLPALNGKLIPANLEEPDEGVENVIGKIQFTQPIGKKGDGKIYPFKYHYAIVPYDTKRNVPIPIKVGIIFATGDRDKAIKMGAKAAGLEWDGKSWVEISRYFQLNHGVAPKEKALHCLDCHGPWWSEHRLPFVELGYGHFPGIAFGLGMIFTPVILIGGAFYIYKRKKN